MSKELDISAASHERRVAILEEGQLVEIYIEREKEFALVGSIYKGKVTRVLPGMQSAFVDIGLDGDAFLYVSDVFENLEDYEHSHPGEHPQTHAATLPPAVSSSVELLPGESLARVHEQQHQAETHPEEARTEEHAAPSEFHAATEEHAEHIEEHHEEAQPVAQEEAQAEAAEERQPESNASAPANYSPQYNPTQNYPARSGNDRERGQSNYGRGGDRGRGGRWGRRGGRRRGGRPQGGTGGRILPPSKYASTQGESRGYDNRRQEGPRSAGPSSSEAAGEPVLLPGESLAKYRGKPQAAPAPHVEHETHEVHPETEESSPRAASSLPATGPGSAGVPRRFSGGLPRWLLAESGR